MSQLSSDPAEVFLGFASQYHVAAQTLFPLGKQVEAPRVQRWRAEALRAHEGARAADSGAVLRMCPPPPWRSHRR